ncbi:MAG: DNA methyltransferase [Bacteroidia bacterium]
MEHLISKKVFNQYLKSFDFSGLFVDLGWAHAKKREPVEAANEVYTLNAAAEKQSFVVLICDPGPDGKIPESAIRRTIEKKVRSLFFEHIIIYVDKAQKEQLWQLVIREPNKPARIVEHRYHVNQAADFLYEKLQGLLFTLDEEGNIGIVDVKARVQAQFSQNAEKVTKKFYAEFKQQHGAFRQFIDGIAKETDKDWYTSLMLNRLMFIYFIQKKGFLDKNFSYLQDKLKEVKAQKGKGKFFSFYRNFLMRLFHEGLGNPDHSDADLQKLIGRVPYLNGGLFDVHELEKDHAKINIKDEAFEKVFAFFDKYNWHLNTNISSSGKDINPDVIGYIFEKYINDRAQMGAYYTKEDITDYIGKNCIIPYLFDQVKERCKEAFTGDSSLWNMLKEQPDRYIYPAMKHGVWEEPPTDGKDGNLRELPGNIEIGVDTSKPNLIERRKDWNTSAIEEYALPTEIWRETVTRRQRYFEVRNKLVNGEVTNINDFITYNLDIRQFAQDAVEQYEGIDFTRAFYRTLQEVTILDPTCGSGAFLFAALNILQPLYEACLLRMGQHKDDMERQNRNKNTYKNEREILAQAAQHPNLDYYILKNIILRNLYGVDIMNEAVEIAKLRLFLKMVAVAEPDYQKENLGLEPLPDIDFNIRAGNTLVGFATEAELNKSWHLFPNDLYDNPKEAKTRVNDKMDYVAKAFTRFKEVQTAHVQLQDFKSFKDVKSELEIKLKELRNELDYVHALTYGIYPNTSRKQFEDWKQTHQPFHWFAEYYGIVHDRGGFDVVIGNPPYVEYSKVKKSYSIIGLKTIQSGNLFAFCIEKALNILQKKGWFGYIVPVSLTCTQRMASLQNQFLQYSDEVWLSSYGERPSKLFEGAEVLLSICMFSKGSQSLLRSTNLRKWHSDYRPHLFETTQYSPPVQRIRNYIIPKAKETLEVSIIQKLSEGNSVLEKFYTEKNKNKIYYRIGGGRYWKIFTTFQPNFVLNGTQSVSSRENYLYFDNLLTRDLAVAQLSSTLFFWWYSITTNGRDMNPVDLAKFPFAYQNLSSKTISALQGDSQLLMADYSKKKVEKEKVSTKTGNVIYEEFYPRLSKGLIDQIDIQLAHYYTFTEEELDFIINYDIKYRMGKELEGNEE